MTTSVSHEQICDRIFALEEEAAALAADLAAKQAGIAALRSLLPDEGEEAPPEKPARRDPGNGQAPAGKSTPKVGGVKGVSKYPPLIRELLLKEQLSQEGIAKRLGKAAGCFAKVLQSHPWFEKVNGLWHLTELGRTGS